MTPKEKAKELVDKYWTLNYEWDGSTKKEWAIEGALIAVDEMIVQNGELYLSSLGEKAIDFYMKKNNYLFEVKQEIPNL